MQKLRKSCEVFVEIVRRYQAVELATLEERCSRSLRGLRVTGIPALGLLNLARQLCQIETSER